MENPIMIMAAMEDVELDLLKDNLTDINVVYDKNCIFYEGKIFNKNVVLCKTGVGLINAAIATLLTIQRYIPKAIIAQGTAGAHDIKLHTNDIVVSTEVLNINSIETPNKGKGEGSNSLEWRISNFDNNELIIEKTDGQLLEMSKKINYKCGNVYFGRVGSGDVWNKEIDRIIMFSEKYQTLCEEMEGYAIAKVAKEHDVPFIDIRVISNNELLGEKYTREAGKHSQEFVLELIKLLN